MHSVTVLHNEILCSWCQIAAKIVNIQVSLRSRRVCMKQKTTEKKKLSDDGDQATVTNLNSATLLILFLLSVAVSSAIGS